jgi:uncharacterized membrane protein
VRYIVVGPLENLHYQSVGLAKFEKMAVAGSLQKVFYNDEVTIYEVTGLE